jgi:hypothetical protein
VKSLARPVRTALVALALALGLLVPAAAYAQEAPAGVSSTQSADPGSPLPLSSLPHQLVLTGRGASQFAYYAFDYEGTGQIVTIGMQVDKPALDQGQVGFRVYGPQTGTVYATGGQQPGLSPNIAADFQSTAKARYLVQVYDADPRGLPFNASIWASGPGLRVPAELAAPAGNEAEASGAAPATKGSVDFKGQAAGGSRLTAASGASIDLPAGWTGKDVSSSPAAAVFAAVNLDQGLTGGVFVVKIDGAGKLTFDQLSSSISSSAAKRGDKIVSAEVITIPSVASKSGSWKGLLVVSTGARDGKDFQEVTFYFAIGDDVWTSFVRGAPNTSISSAAESVGFMAASIQP